MFGTIPAPSSSPGGSSDPFEARTRARVDRLEELAQLAMRAARALTARLEEECELGKATAGETMVALRSAGRMARQTDALADRIDRTARDLMRKEAEADRTLKAEARRRVLDRHNAVGVVVAKSIQTAADGDEEKAERLYEALDAYEKLEDPADYLNTPTGRLAGRICREVLGIDTDLSEITLETLLADEADFGPYGPPRVTASPGATPCPKCAAAQAAASSPDSS